MSPAYSNGKYQVMSHQNKADRIELLRFDTVQMRTFHLSWIAFFLCFFGWFSHAPLMHSTIGPDLGLTESQKMTAFMCSVGVTVISRMIIGGICDSFGPRKTYVGLLIFGALSVAGSSFAYNWPTYLFSRICIGVIGASFVITQYHTSVMFSPHVIGIANATTAGWGNLGGGVTQAITPMIAATMLSFGIASSELSKWRPAMYIPALIMLLVAALYWHYTLDTPEGNYSNTKASSSKTPSQDSNGIYLAIFDYRVWILFLMYAGCFGVELFINGRAASYYQKNFDATEGTAGLFAALFGLMNIFARSTGGRLSDVFSRQAGLSGRIKWLVSVMILEGIVIIAFSQIDQLGLAIIIMMLSAFFVQMAAGATYSVVPFINPKFLGIVAGIVGAGGNVGAVCYTNVMLRAGLSFQDTLFWLGFFVIAIGLLGYLIRAPSPRTLSILSQTNESRAYPTANTTEANLNRHAMAHTTNGTANGH